MALFTVLQQGGGERQRDTKPVIEVIVEEEGGKQWALTDTAVSLITAKCDTMSKAIITAHSLVNSLETVSLRFLLYNGLSKTLIQSLKLWCL